MTSQSENKICQNDKTSFEDYIDIINVEINKRKRFWRLKAIAWMEFDDVAQIIRMHIFKQWYQWDVSRPLEPWLNAIISNQLKNILRNNYGNFARPCLNCPFNQGSAGIEEGTNLCGYTPSGLQNSECPVYAKWERTKKPAHDVKLPLSIENHSQEVFSAAQDGFNEADTITRLIKELEKALTPKQFTVFVMKYLDNKSDEEISLQLGFTTSEAKRKAGYRQIKNIQKIIITKAKKIIETKDIFMH